MNSEIFVINAVKSSDKAFSAVAEHIDCSDADRLVRLLQNPEKVGLEERRLGLIRGQLFEFLEKVIRDSFERRPLPRLTYDRLSALLKNDVQKHLAKALYPDGDVLQSLFSVSALQDTLEFLGSNTSRFPANAKLLLSEILKRDYSQRLQNTYMTTANNWEIILKNEEWLESDAVQKLLETDAGITSSNPYLVLATLIDEYNLMQEKETEPDKDLLLTTGHIGPLALLSIRRRIFSIIDNFYEQSIQNSENLPKSPIMRFLEPLINIYELGYVAKGIRKFMATPSKLRELLPFQDYSQTPVEEEKIDVFRPLIYFEEKSYSVSGHQMGNFEIRCTVDGKEQTILKVIGAPDWVCQQLKQDIPHLVPVKLPKEEGDTVCERLLNTCFPLEPESIARLRSAISNMESAFIQAVILSSDGRIAGIPNVWGKPIPDRLQFDEIPVTADPEYVVDVEAQIARLKSQYGYPDEAIRRGIKRNLIETNQSARE